MKTLIPVVAMLMTIGNVSAQYTPTLEFVAGQGPSGSGPSIGPQTIIFENNANNPSGNSFVPFTTPATTVTCNLSNQQYVLPASQSNTGASVVFGGGNNLGRRAINGYTYYNTMGNYSSPSNTDFTSAVTVAAGTGIDITQNYSLQLFTSVMGMYNTGASTSGRYYMADLTITFNTPVTDPVLHIVGIGSSFNTLGFSTEFELVTPSLSLTLLSGSPEMVVSGNQILNGASHFSGTTGSGGASGSVLVTGTNITSLTLQVYVQGDGQGSAWANGSASGDGWMIGVSMLTSAVVVLPLSITHFTATSANRSATLQWDAAGDANSGFFDVESSRDATAWQSVATVSAVRNNGGSLTTYRYTDGNAATGNDFYRIKAIDALGNTVYSTIRSVYIDGQTPARVFPNPVRDRLFITGDISALESVVVTSADGREMLRVRTPAAGDSIDLSSLPGGIYFVTFRYASGLRQTMSIVKR